MFCDFQDYPNVFDSSSHTYPVAKGAGTLKYASLFASGNTGPVSGSAIWGYTGPQVVYQTKVTAFS